MTPSSRGLALGALVLAGAALLASACGDPYEYLEDETISLGAVDPVTFPAASLGADGNRMRPGFGSFEEQPVWVAGQQTGYLRYPIPASMQPAMGGPLVPATAATVFAFDATDPTPVPDKNPCTPPPGWIPNRREDDVRYDQQGNVFTALPTASYNPGVASSTSYVPVVAEAPVSSSGRQCQQFKSRKALVQALGDQLPGGSGKYLAWMIIDPAAAVYPLEYVLLSPEQQSMMPHNGLGLQKWGWYNRYLLAYLDGGYIPTQMMGTRQVMVTQRLYLPRSPVMAGTMMVNAQLGQGLEVLTARRGQPGYSPVCEVMTYDAGGPLAPDAFPRDAATIEMMFGAAPPMGMMPNLRPAATPFVFCLQVR